ncbi:MAG: hypothetical protein HY094_08960 [Candidatus Melainabacteria bacterium]|nr:hypothetical protein [Candidatus Melainabacteria bacterium]
MYPITSVINMTVINNNEVDQTTKLYEPKDLFEGRAPYRFRHINLPSRGKIGSLKKADFASVIAMSHDFKSLNLLGVYEGKGKELKDVSYNGQLVKRAALFRLVCPQYTLIHNQVVECEPDRLFSST